MKNLRIAWLLVAAPFYWHPILAEFTRLFPQTILFTGSWSKFAYGLENLFAVEVVGNRKVIKFNSSTNTKAYNSSVTYLSPTIISHLLNFKADVIFSDGFCIWTVLALFIKLFLRCRIIVICDGSSPSVDYKKSVIRLFTRRIMTRFIDAFITNTCAGKDYLIEVIGAKEDRVFTQPYLVPDTKTLLQESGNYELKELQLRHPIFIYVGQIIPRKGIHELLEACSFLQSNGCQEYTLLIVGEGWEREKLEEFSKKQELGSNVKWLGPVEYNRLGNYLKHSDVFVFPTHEDVWGMVIPEAMALGKPILTSKWAGAAELVIEGENGYRFEPNKPEKLAELMRYFINKPTLVDSMGEKSRHLMNQYTPETAVNFLSKVISSVIEN